MEKHTLESALKRIHNLENSRLHFKSRNEHLESENIILLQNLEKSRFKEHESNLKVSALEKSIKNITESQVIQKQAFENMERQVKQLSESGSTVKADNDRLSQYLNDARKTIDSLNDRVHTAQATNESWLIETELRNQQIKSLTTNLNNKSILNWIFAAIAFGELAVLLLR